MISNYEMTGHWLDYIRSMSRQCIAQGDQALVASVIFSPFGSSGVRHYVKEEEASKTLKVLLKHFDRMNGGRNKKHGKNRVKRLVFKHTGANGENIHYHIVLYMPKDSDLDVATSKYYAALRWVNERQGRINLKESICERAIDEKGISAVIYGGHEVYNDRDSMIESQTVL